MQVLKPEVYVTISNLTCATRHNNPMQHALKTRAVPAPYDASGMKAAVAGGGGGRGGRAPGGGPAPPAGGDSAAPAAGDPAPGDVEPPPPLPLLGRVDDLTSLPMRSTAELTVQP